MTGTRNDAPHAIGMLASSAARLHAARAVEAARERAKRPVPPPDPNLPKWWEYEEPER